MEAINHNIAIEWYMDFLAGELSEEKTGPLKGYLEANPDLKEELHADKTIWNQLGKIETPEPSMAMDARFESALAGYMAGSAKQSQRSFQLPGWLTANLRMGLAFSLIGLVIGFAVFRNPAQQSEIATLTNEVQGMKKMMMLTLIEQPGAQQRIKAVSMAQEFVEVDDKVIKVLGNTLQTDDNVNVRLAAIDALLSYWDNATARQIMVESIAFQSSPIVQSAIADAMLSLREKQAIGEFEKLMTDEEINEAVKSKIESTIDQLKSI
ncbi:MAG: HEAT repeat domain-containing protein [Cytophagales bacterium]|nr:HEAT repeat domain-containing protein [Cytophagales bacterium]